MGFEWQLSVTFDFLAGGSGPGFDFPAQVPSCSAFLPAAPTQLSAVILRARLAAI